MTTFTNVPKEVEKLLEEGTGGISRRNFLKGSGLLVVSVGAAAMARRLKRRRRAQGFTPTRTSGNSTPGS